MVDQAREGKLSPFVRSIRTRKTSVHLRGRVLDIGCGSGSLASLVESDRYVGVDVDSASIEQACRDYPTHTFLTDISEIDGKFDTVVALAVIEHIDDRRRFIEQAKAVLSDDPNARIVLTTPAPWTDQIHGWAARLRLLSAHAHDEHEDLLGRADLDRLAVSAGLTMSRYRRFLAGMNQLAVLQREPVSVKVAGGLTEEGIVVGNYFDKYGSKNPIVQLLNRGFSRSLDNMVDATAPSSIHEVGCGEGYWVMKWQAAGIKASGSDFSTQVIEIARQNATRSGGNPAAFAVRSVYDLEALTSAADLIVCCEVLEHVDDPRRALQRICELQPSHVVLSVPREPIWRVLNVARGKYLARWGNTPGHIQHWSKRSFVAFASQYLDIVAVESPTPWTMILGRPRSGRA